MQLLPQHVFFPDCYMETSTPLLQRVFSLYIQLSASPLYKVIRCRYKRFFTFCSSLVLLLKDWCYELHYVFVTYLEVGVACFLLLLRTHLFSFTRRTTGTSYAGSSMEWNIFPCPPIHSRNTSCNKKPKTTSWTLVASMMLLFLSFWKVNTVTYIIKIIYSCGFMV